MHLCSAKPVPFLEEFFTVAFEIKWRRSLSYSCEVNHSVVLGVVGAHLSTQVVKNFTGVWGLAVCINDEVFDSIRVGLRVDIEHIPPVKQCFGEAFGDSSSELATATNKEQCFSESVIWNHFY